MTIKNSISSFVLIILSLTLYWRFRVYVSESTYIPFLQFGLISILIALNPNFIFKKDFDSYLVFIFALYIAINSSVYSIFNDASAVYSLGSAAVSISLLIPFFVSRGLGGLVNFRFLVWVIYFGLSIFLLYYLVVYFLSAQYEMGGISSRTMRQRVPVLMNLTLLLSLLLTSKSILVNIYTKVIFLCALFFIVLSYSKGAYLLLVINLILLLKYTNLRTFMLLLIFLLITGIIFIQFSRVTGLYETDFIVYRFDQLSRMFQDYTSFGSSYERVEIWRALYDYMTMETPRFFFGNGESGPHVANLFIDKPEFKSIMTSESQYMSTFFRGGLLGLIFQVLIIFRITFLSYKLKFLDKENSDFFLVLFIYFIGVILYLSFNPSLRDREYGVLFYFLYGLIVLRMDKTYNRIPVV